eukprot:m.504196 g.504196  ORF g.504196 m.504196 type:complete len:135 (+) comp21856_c0_seq7:74-478(+)
MSLQWSVAYWGTLCMRVDTAVVWCRYATFAYLAGVDPVDHSAAAYHLPPIDSVNLWPTLSNNASSTRTTIVLSMSTVLKRMVACMHVRDHDVMQHATKKMVLSPKAWSFRSTVHGAANLCMCASVCVSEGRRCV